MKNWPKLIIFSHFATLNLLIYKQSTVQTFFLSFVNCIYKSFIVKMTKLSFLVFFLLSFSVCQSNFTVTLKCQKCSITCSNENCYRVTNTEYDRQVCGASSCVLGNIFNAQIHNCTYRYVQGSNDTNASEIPACSTKICYKIPGKTRCLTSECLACDFSYNYSCISCVDQALKNTCKKNCQYHSDIFIGTRQTCSSSKCMVGLSINKIIGPCANGQDTFGNKCTCCDKSIILNMPKMGVCTSDFWALGTTQFTTYATYKLGLNSSNDTKTTFQNSLTILYLSLMIAFIILII